MLPPTPPPEVDLEAWERTIDELERREPGRLALIHFGVFEDVERHLEELRRRLHDWAERVRAGASEEQFAGEAAADLADDESLEDIDRLALRYTGKPFRTRDKPRVSAWLEPERWHGWG